ncbi:osmotically-inducible lipoprotein B [Amylibacter sp. IMCC11727]|uniref:osmotically-inducible lipoprotein B n=1 Tax=Amylibacter sp. IMCC11727 TaxID=3039851 RepID=UPI00244E1B91|nr:osmotically-inducible lipoprotein B [Amylibacter sp. IMCC11727]WGI20617.1 osmotically-inducible lipoprotein B [Amylibacter sp. IMCC11727]
MHKSSVLAALVAVFGLSACNTTAVDQRTVNRTAIGAGAGAVGALLLDGNPIKGAVVGGVVGAVTSKDQLVWE